CAGSALTTKADTATTKCARMLVSPHAKRVVDTREHNRNINNKQGLWGRMNLRNATIVIALLDALAWIAIVVAVFKSDSDPATIGFDHAAGVIVTALFGVTGLPALALASTRRAPRAALSLALAFPGVFALLFAAAVVFFVQLS